MATQTLPQSEVQETKKTATQYAYSFGGGKADGNGKMKDDLGGKGAGLAEMTNAGLPVPPGFTIQTEACREYILSSCRSGCWPLPFDRADGMSLALFGSASSAGRASWR